MSERNVTPMQLPFKIKPWMIVLVIILIVVIYSVVQVAYTVGEGEQAVVLTFGKVSRIEEPGLRFKLPSPFEEKYIVNLTENQYMDFGFRRESGLQSQEQSGFPEEARMFTGDLNLVETKWSIIYKISDPVKWLFKVDDTVFNYEIRDVFRDSNSYNRSVRMGNREKTIMDISIAVMNQVIGDRPLLDVRTTERGPIASEAMKKMQELVNLYELGIRIEGVNIDTIDVFSKEVDDAFDDVIAAKTEMQKLFNDAEAVYNDAVTKAEGTKNEMIANARGYAAERINNAKGDVARFLANYNEYRLNPKVMRVRLYLETMSDILENNPNIDFYDPELANFRLLSGLGRQ